MPNAARWILYLIDGSKDVRSGPCEGGGRVRARLRAWIARRRTRLEILALLVD